MEFDLTSLYIEEIVDLFPIPLNGIRLSSHFS